MRRVRYTAKICAVLASALLLASCGTKEEDAPDPAATADDGPRSIFREDPAEAGEGVLPAPTLPPLETTLSFADGTPELTEAVRAELATIVDSPQMEAGGAIVLRGHSDSDGSDEDNLEASRERAEAVREFFVENGIDEARITVIAFGEQNPLAPNALSDGSPNEEGRATNRRVEVTIDTGRNAERKQTLIETLTEETAEEGAGPEKKATPAPAKTPVQ